MFILFDLHTESLTGCVTVVPSTGGLVVEVSKVSVWVATCSVDGETPFVCRDKDCEDAELGRDIGDVQSSVRGILLTAFPVRK